MHLWQPLFTKYLWYILQFAWMLLSIAILDWELLVEKWKNGNKGMNWGLTLYICCQGWIQLISSYYSQPFYFSLSRFKWHVFTPFSSFYYYFFPLKKRKRYIHTVFKPNTSREERENKIIEQMAHHKILNS